MYRLPRGVVGRRAPVGPARAAPLERRPHHGRRQAAGERVLLARVERREQERGRRRSGAAAPCANAAASRREPAAQRYNRRHASNAIRPRASTPRRFGISRHVSRRKPKQFVHLGRRRLVARRGAVGDAGDGGVDQPQAVVAVERRRAGWRSRSRTSRGSRKSPERSPVNIRPVRLPAVRRGREAHDQQPRRRLAQVGQRLAPIVLVAERGALLGGDGTCSVRAGAGSGRTTRCAIGGPTRAAGTARFPSRSFSVHGGVVLFRVRPVTEADT